MRNTKEREEEKWIIDNSTGLKLRIFQGIQLGLTNTEIAEEIGIHFSTVSEIRSLFTLWQLHKKQMEVKANG